jgi:hypothetical protein
MAQLKDKPDLDTCSNMLTEVTCEADNTGELKDALLDDQVMVFPKWHATCEYNLLLCIIFDFHFPKRKTFNCARQAQYNYS